MSYGNAVVFYVTADCRGDAALSGWCRAAVHGRWTYGRCRNGFRQSALWGS